MKLTKKQRNRIYWNALMIVNEFNGFRGIVCCAALSIAKEGHNHYPQDIILDYPELLLFAPKGWEIGGRFCSIDFDQQDKNIRLNILSFCYYMTL